MKQVNVIEVTLEAISALLDLPPKHEVTRLFMTDADLYRNTVSVMVKGPYCNKTPEGNAAMIIPSSELNRRTSQNE